jgi:peptide/nickel transport system substrate-binding protein
MTNKNCYGGENMQKKLLAIVGIVAALAVVLGACTAAPQTVVETVVVTEEVIKTEVVTQIETVEAPIERKGAWLDTIIMVAEPSVESAVARILADDIDIYAQSSESPEAFATVKEEGLNYVSTVGSYKEITFNPVFELNDGTINPFGIAKVREAMNKLVDRDYIAQEIMGGLGLPKTVPMTGVFPDYANFAAVAREIENKYAYDPETAGTEIGAELEAVGAELVDGKWNYNGEPITVIFLIRTEDKRMQIGDYIANQLEEYAGLTVDRQYKTSSEASPLWLQSDPADGLWHLYTGGWITTAIDRNQTTLLGDFYTYLGWPGNPLWNAYQTTDEFFEIADALYNSNYSTVEERADLFTKGLYMALENSNRIWLVDDLSYSPMASDVSVTYDLASGASGTPLYAHTLRFEDQVGGEMVYAMSDLLVEPWNPLGGSNWIYDSAAQRATGDFGTIPDPYTGLSLPERIESASIVAEEGLPIGITYDWLTLDFQPEIQVPGDTWVDWNAADQVFVTADEKLAAMAEDPEATDVPEYMTAKIKSTVVYPADLFDTVTWHDGSPFSVADIVMALILQFDPAMEDSEIFDEAQAGPLASFMTSFKGVRIASMDPLTIEYYTDNWQLDAENNVVSLYPGSWYPFGEGSWDMMAIGYMAERDGELAFTADKAEELDIEYMSFISGPSLEVLKAKLDSAIEESFIPYAPTLGQFITADEAAARYANLLDWYRVQGHFWVGTGPFYLNKVFPVEKTLTLTRYQDYPDLVTKWAGFGEPKIADVEVDGPARVTIGEEATYTAFVTFKGEAYASSDIKEVKYLVFDATGALAGSGLAEMVDEGQYDVTLSADVTGALEAGSNKIEIIVVPLVVSVPTFSDFEFVTAE